MSVSRFQVNGQTIEIDDDEDNPVVVARSTREIDTDNVVTIPTGRSAAAKGVSGRGRFHNGVCPLHGLATDGSPCAKFSHLPGNGRGIKRPNIALKFVVFIRILIKPGVAVGICFAAYYILTHFVTLGILSHGISVTPTTAVHTPATSAPGIGGQQSQSPVVPGKSGSNGNGPSGGIGSNCLVPGNPCHLILPGTVTK